MKAPLCTRLITALAFILTFASNVTNAADSAWHDPSPHRVRFVPVARDVTLETLDWGGRGRPVVLLAGGGHTAHVFDDFALKLTRRYHVYAITRRGSPPSSVPEDDYAGNRLGDDVVAVIDALQMKQPVLIGHSFAGLEMSDVAARHPDRIAGLVYLDAIHSWDAQWEAQGLYKIVSWKQQLAAFQEKFNELVDEPFDSRPLAHQMLATQLPQLQNILETLIKVEDGRPPRPDPTETDLADFKSLQAWYARNAKVVLPEAEFRMMQATDDAGHPIMQRRRPRFVGPKMDAGRQKYTDVRVPALGIFAVINDTGTISAQDTEALANAAAYRAFQEERADRQIVLFRRDLPQAKVVRIERADHYVFLSNQSQVLSELDDFIARLPR